MKKRLLIVGLCLPILAGCFPASAPSGENSVQNGGLHSSVSVVEKGYKQSFFGGQIPLAWSEVSMGDIGTSSLPSDIFLDPQNIVFSFGSHNVAYGDLNWEQVDFYLMGGPDMAAFVERLKTDKDFSQWVAAWTTETINGRKATVAEMKTEPDGTVDKGGTGGKMYFVYPTTKNAPGVIMNKQAKGSTEFESGFAHYLQTVDFSEGM